jgi:NAD(P)-binding Rossmann-like domain
MVRMKPAFLPTVPLAHSRSPLSSIASFNDRIRRRPQINVTAHASLAPPQPQSLSDLEYDVVVIGSGIGGLSTAALLSAAYGKSVCVLESHTIAGGAAHAFTRTLPAASSGDAPLTFSFDSGPHLFSGLTSGGGGKELSANPMNHVLRAAKAPLLTFPYTT